MTTKPENHDDVIDSRDVIARIEELVAIRTALEDAADEAREAYEFHNSDDTEEGPEWDELHKANGARVDWSETDEAKELNSLLLLAGQCEHVSDWEHGETLINEDYFTSYIEDLIDDAYEMPKEMNSGNWPYRHMTMDYAAAAEEAKVDYEEVDFEGQTFLIRSV